MKNFSKKILFILILSLISGSILFLLSSLKRATYDDYSYHSKVDMALFESMDYPTESNSLFTGSGTCLMCHGDPDQYPSSTANRDSAGNDVSPLGTWSASMMANSSKDPFWRAKVQHESILNPGLEAPIQTLCTTCHAPLGHFDALHNSLEYYSIEDLESDVLGLDGVSCNACHMMENIGLGSTFSGDITYNEDHVEYGQYEDPFQNPMINHIGFTPEHGAHVSSAQACAKCHTLITQTIDEDGEIGGNTFVEQAVYHEWLNSIYSEEDITCVKCHMETLSESIKLSPMPPWLDGRENFSKHNITGGNAFMLNILKNNSEALAVNASAEQFDSTISQSRRMLQQRSLDLDVNLYSISSDSAIIEVQLHNKSGHKLPSGYPSRKMMVEFTLRNAVGDTLFRSGGFDEENRIIGESNSDFEMHYNTITSEDQVQIYEYVMANEAGEVTTMLTRAYSPLKDNRLTPLGFTMEHAAYDTVSIVGNALMDPNFNIDNGAEGSGSDKIYYHVPVPENIEGLSVNVNVYYIAVPRKWLDELFEEDAAAINSFETMYNAEEESAVLMRSASLELSSTSIKEEENERLMIYPNPSFGSIFVSSADKDIQGIELWDLNAKLIKTSSFENKNKVQVFLPETKGKYFLKIIMIDGTIVTKPVLKL